MSMNEAEILSQCIHDIIVGGESDVTLSPESQLKIGEWVSELVDLSDPNADKVRSLEKENEKLKNQVKGLSKALFDLTSGKPTDSLECRDTFEAVLKAQKVLERFELECSLATARRCLVGSETWCSNHVKHLEDRLERLG